MEEQMASHLEETTTAAETQKKVQLHLLSSRQREAYELLKNAVGKYSDDALLLSYYGYLKAALDGKYRSGIEDCMRAISLFQKKMWVGDDNAVTAHKAVLYLNLGKAYYAAGRRKDAIDTFHKGLQFDPNNRDLRTTLQKVGIRKLIPIPFLDRSNPINAFFGRMLRRAENQPNVL
jgi:tetratricopeptide (TPR) repeat protein